MDTSTQQLDAPETLNAYLSALELDELSPVVLADPHGALWTAVVDAESQELYLHRIRLSPFAREQRHTQNTGIGVALVEGYYLHDAASIPADIWPMVPVALPGEARSAVSAPPAGWFAPTVGEMLMLDAATRAFDAAQRQVMGQSRTVARERG